MLSVVCNVLPCSLVHESPFIILYITISQEIRPNNIFQKTVIFIMLIPVTGNNSTSELYLVHIRITSDRQIQNVQ